MTLARLLVDGVPGLLPLLLGAACLTRADGPTRADGAVPPGGGGRRPVTVPTQRRGERGSISVEQVLITAGLVAAAFVAVAVVADAVQRYAAGI